MRTIRLAAASPTRKRAVNFALHEGLVVQAKTYISNLLATKEELLTVYVAQQ